MKSLQKNVSYGPNSISKAKNKKLLILVDHSTIHPQKTIKMAEQLKMNSGIEQIDAPVSGGVEGAESGSLTIMAGGQGKNIKKLYP